VVEQRGEQIGEWVLGVGLDLDELDREKRLVRPSNSSAMLSRMGRPTRVDLVGVDGGDDLVEVVVKGRFGVGEQTPRS
jgi:hypothetical protein